MEVRITAQVDRWRCPKWIKRNVGSGSGVTAHLDQILGNSVTGDPHQSARVIHIKNSL